MSVSLRSRKTKTLTVEGREFEVEILEIPFREGVELRCNVNGEELCISDRQLGEHEAFRLLEDEIKSELCKLRS